MPDWLQGETFKWIANNGFAVVIAILLLTVIVAPILALLRYVIFDAVRYFTNRLDTLSQAQSENFREIGHQQAVAFERLADALERQNETIGHLTEAISLNREQAVRNNEAISAMLMFTSHTQQEIVAHRVESRQAMGLPPLEVPVVPGVQAGEGTGVLKPVEMEVEERADDETGSG